MFLSKSKKFKLSLLILVTQTLKNFCKHIALHVFEIIQSLIFHLYFLLLMVTNNSLVSQKKF